MFENNMMTSRFISETVAKICQVFILLVLLTYHGKPWSEEVFWKDWQFNGFGTIGYIQSDKYDDRLPRRGVYQSASRVYDNGFLMDSRLGLQVKGDLNDHFSLVAQMVLREQYDHALESYIDIAFIKYQATEQWRISLGRQAFDLFFLSDHRNTGYSYEWVRPPTQFYGFLPFQFFDGIKFSKDWGDFDNEWHFGFSVGDVNSLYENDVKDSYNEVDKLSGDPLIDFVLMWQSGEWRIRGNLSYLELYDSEYDNELESNNPDWGEWEEWDAIYDDFDGDNSFIYSSLGLEWLKNSWKVQAEFNHIDTDMIGFNGHRGYLSISYRFNQWQPFGYASYARDTQEFNYAPPRPGMNPQAHHHYRKILKYMQSMRHNERAVGIGVRWDFATQKALKLQCDRYIFDPDSGSVFGRVDQVYPIKEHNSWCSVAFDWVF